MVPENDVFTPRPPGENDAKEPTSELDWGEHDHWPDDAMPTQVVEGEIRKGKVVAIQDDGVVVDIQTKYEGIIPIVEFPDSSELPQIDEEIEVAVVKVDEERDTIRLSKKRADFIRVWNELEKAAAEGGVVNGTVTERVKGGLRVDVGVPGFVPASHVAVRNPRVLDRFVGHTLRLKVLEADRAANKVILSHRQVIEEERERRRQETLSRLQEGMVCEGKVRNITNYGAFVDLGGVDGLLHVSEMAWGHIQHPSEVVNVGDIIRVVVLKIEDGGNRISLGRRQILPDPWKTAAEKLKVGQTVKARITRVVRTGAFAAVEGVDVEGFIPRDEMVLGHTAKPENVVKQHQEVEAQVLDLDPKARKLRLSMAAVEEQARRRELQQFAGGREESTQTLGERFPELFKEMRGPQAEDEETARESADEQPAEKSSTQDATDSQAASQDGNQESDQ